MFGLDAFHLARVQFAFTVSFHIIFPAITIGLAQLSGGARRLMAKQKIPLALAVPFLVEHFSPSTSVWGSFPGW